MPVHCSRAVAFGSALFIGMGVAASAAHADETITVGDVGSGSANHWPAYIAMDKGFFKQQGIAIEYIKAASSAGVQQQVASGSVDMGVGGLVDPIRAIDKGAPITLLRIEAQAAPYELIAKPSIKTIADLKHKVVMVGGVKDITRIFMQRMLEPNGIKPGDYDVVYAGATALRFAALKSGSIDATILNSPYNFKAVADGMNSLAATPDYVKNLPFTGYAVNIAWAKDHKPAITKFLAAYAKGVDWLHDPKNRDEAVTILMKHSKVDRADVEKTYDFFQNLKMFDDKGDIVGSGIGNLISILKDLGDVEGATDVSRFYDAEFASSK